MSRPTFPITQDMVDGLITTPLALALKQVHDRDPAWKGQQQWDDLAALFIVRPGLFKRDGQHYLPSVEPGMMRYVGTQSHQWIVGLAVIMLENSLIRFRRLETRS